MKSELPKTYSEARDIGAIYYFTGKPCVKGHITKRATNGRLCFECKAITRKKWRAKNPERTRELNRNNMKSEKRKISLVAWREKNREKLRKQNMVRYHKDPEKFNAMSRNWKSKNQEVCRTYCRNRKALLKNAEGHHTKSDIDALYTQQHGECVVCATSLLDGYHVDHIVAISKGGRNSPDNLQLLCAPCNQSKGDKDFDEWLQKKVVSL